MIYILIGLALIFDFFNGFHDSSNVVATVISSKAMSPRRALSMAAIMEFIAPFIFGVAVAETVGKGLIIPESINTYIVIAALIAAVIWNILTWLLGIPSSSSHALVGGLLGGSILESGFAIVQTAGLLKILAALLFSPLLGFLTGYLIMFIIRRIPNLTTKANNKFKRLQLITSIALALSHGTNDAQKTMGIITLGLVTAGLQKSFEVPIWVIAISAGAIALGTSFGGWKLIKTLGGRIYKIRPVDAFSSQLASAFVILGAALLGGPVSTTHVVSTAIMGSGTAERIKKVRWGVGREMAITWLLTIPATFLTSALIYFILRTFI